MTLPTSPVPKGAINRCRTCGALIPRRRKYCSRPCRAHFQERLKFLSVTLRKIKARYASLTVSPGMIELVVMPWSGDHVSLFRSAFNPGTAWQWAMFEFTLGVNEQWHLLRRRWRSEKLASRELLSENRTEMWRKAHFDLDLSGGTSGVSRDVHRALRALSIEGADLKKGDFLALLRKRFAEKVHAVHPDRVGPGDTRAFMKVKQARDTLRDRWTAGDLEALLSGKGGKEVSGNPMPWSFFFDGYTGRWHYPD